jgi:hypothetical protein
VYWQGDALPDADVLGASPNVTSQQTHTFLTDRIQRGAPR